ncbi:glucosamine inositolphosphorylceramide transferase family protein [Rhodopseudomonas palustris]|uniref:Glucosamine inositolphosphorylceramide transferase 1 N-terminal domain-containing protein n=1 Tax=Rhodopseudomonas palustris TaxID=1076 RepID=A0A418UY92_RHOPL|nr:hypothetical protein [Rhodopseudomonas palustris]RJF66609.1 hypothetical protein D4Q52_23945 [Rhodopseudomonas palustris]
MIVELRFDDRRPRRWMRHAIDLLGCCSHKPQIAWVRTEAERPPGLESLLELERLLMRRGRPCGADADPDLARAHPSALLAADIVVDFSAMPRDPARSYRLYLRPLYDGVAGEDAALAAIVAGDLPTIDIVDEISGGVVWSGKPSGEAAEGLGGALETVMARTATLVKGVLDSGARPVSPHPAPSHRPRSPAAFVLRSLASRIARRIYRLCCYSPHWRIGWRHTDDGGIWASGDLSGPSWRAVPSPAHRFYADPFPITWKGRTFVFFEELDHHVGKGFISAIEFGADGPIGPAVTVLDEPWHLSYPFLIVHDDELWMIPESSARHEVTIYKCIEFPHRWERHATLLSGVELADATIVQHDGRHYMFGATRDGAGGYSDTLSIYHADDLFGPWTPHEQRPVLVDRASARPAGHFVRHGGRLWRPVQDCTRGYGGALGLAEITELSPTRFAQTVHHTVSPGPRWPGRKLHTLNRCGRLELIDGTIIQPRIEALKLPDKLGAPAAADSR